MTHAKSTRRTLLKASLAALAGTSLLRWTAARAASSPVVLVIGGGFAGATAAKYLKLWGGDSVQVKLIEPKTTYYTPILSNEVLTGELPLNQLSFSYTALQTRYGIEHIPQKVTQIQPDAKTVTLENGQTLAYDRLIIAPGIEFKYTNAYDTQKVPAAWQGGQAVINLQQQLQAMPANGTFVMTIPPAPYRCPPGPYERACVVADWLKQHKPQARIIVLDANDDQYLLWNGIFQHLFPQYDNLTRISSAHITHVDDQTPSVTYQVANGSSTVQQADVLNVIPPMRAGSWSLLHNAGLLSNQEDWVPVNGQTFESLNKPGIHVIGDAQFMKEVPKAGHVANAEAKVCANAVLRNLNNLTPYSAPQLTSACYSPVSAQKAIWISERFHYQTGANHAEDFKLVDLSVYRTPSSRHKRDMYNWSTNLFNDTFL